MVMLAARVGNPAATILTCVAAMILTNRQIIGLRPKVEDYLILFLLTPVLQIWLVVLASHIVFIMAVAILAAIQVPVI